MRRDKQERNRVNMSCLPAFLFLFVSVFCCLGETQPLVSFRTETTTFGIDDRGGLCRLWRNEDRRDYLAEGQPAPLLSLRVEGKFIAPEKAVWNGDARRLTLQYGSANASVAVHIRSKPTHLVLEIVDVQPLAGEFHGEPSHLVIAQHAPGLRKSVIAAQLLSPPDIEREFRITGGHWHHGELALDQFFMMRPVPGAAQYQTPVDGLYLCGAGCHPGGGVMGLPGRNAARKVLAQVA